MIHRLLKFFNRRFNPSSISNLAIRLDAQNLSSFTFSTGQDISAWGAAAQATANLQPLYVANGINGMPAVQFYDDSTAKLLSIPDSTALDYTKFTLFVVFKRASDLGAVERIAGKFSSSSPANAREHTMLILITDEIQGNISTDGNPGTGFSAGTPVIGTACIGMIMRDATNGTAYLNNVAGVPAAVGAPFQGTSPFHIGAIDGAAQPFSGYIGEILFYTRDLTTAERKSVWSYLSGKWRIPISA